VKVAISGAGIAGPTLAYWLWRGGHTPTLVEKAPRLRTGGYLIDFWGAGYAIAERMGLTPAMQAAGYAVQEVRLVDQRGAKVGGFAVDGFRRNLNGRFISLPRGDLAALIYSAIDANVQTMFGDSITGIEQHDDGVQVAFEHASSRRFDLVIGAGGIHSPVRGLVFGPDSHFETDLGYRVAAFEADGYRPRDELVYVAFTQPGRMVARFAMRNDRTLFLLVHSVDHQSGPDPNDFGEAKTVLHQVFGTSGWECPAILAELDRADEVYFDRVSQIAMDGWSAGRVALIGDAACCVSLLGGEGTGLAMLEAYLLASQLTNAGTDYRHAFHSYEATLRPLITHKQRSARRFASAFAPKTSLGLWTRNQATKLLAIPALTDRVIRREFSDDAGLLDDAMVT
jgi:2-polyprenyl-6-methoxyphenol hydroxylase-like FAD-dependent oxidoreductase